MSLASLQLQQEVAQIKMVQLSLVKVPVDILEADKSHLEEIRPL